MAVASETCSRVSGSATTAEAAAPDRQSDTGNIATIEPSVGGTVGVSPERPVHFLSSRPHGSSETEGALYYERSRLLAVGDNANTNTNSDHTGSKISSATSSFHQSEFEYAEYDLDDDLDDDLDGSEGSFGLDDLMDDEQCVKDVSTTDQGGSSCESSLDSCSGVEDDLNDKNDTTVDASPTHSARNSRSSQRRSKKQKDGDNLSSRALFCEDDSPCFDMSSRSVLEDFDFEVDCSDIMEQRARLPPKAVVKFSAGKVAAKRSDAGTRTARPVSALSMSPMTRITEHTRESSCFGSQSDLSGRFSFESASPSRRYGSIRTRTDSRGDMDKASPSLDASGGPSNTKKRTLLNFEELVEKLRSSKIE